MALLWGCGGEGPTHVTVAGAVRALAQGAPVEGATVTVGPRQTTTDEAGFFSLINVPVGVHPIWVSASDYETLAFPPVLVAESVASQEFLLRKSDPEKGRVVGVVLRDAARRPARSALVTVGEEEIACGPLGLFASRALAPGEYTLEVTAPGLPPKSVAVTVGAGEMVTVEVTLQ